MERLGEGMLKSREVESSQTLTMNRIAALTALVLILSIAAVLRFSHVSQNPGWYSDEGTLMDIALNLLAGRMRYLALTRSTLLAARLPLFPALLSVFLWAFGPTIASLRLLTGLLGLLSILLLVAWMWQAGDVWLALLAGFMLAVYPKAVLYSRVGFSYNLLGALVLVAGIGLHKYRRSRDRKWLLLACISLGLGTLSDVAAFMYLPVVLVVVAGVRLRDLGWAMLVFAAPFLAYAGVMFTVMPDVFAYDASFTFSRLGAIPFTFQIPALILNFGSLVYEYPWLIPGVIGLFLIQPPSLRRLALLLCFFPLAFLGRTIGLLGLGGYYLIPVLPFVALGVAALLRYGSAYAFRTIRDGVQGWVGSFPQLGRTRLGAWLGNRAVALATSLSFMFIFVSPLIVSTGLLYWETQTRMVTGVDPVLVDPEQGAAAAEFVNRRAAPDDVVVASPAVAWLVQANAADFQQALAAAGEPSKHFPTDIPPERFAFDPRFSQARFVIIDNVWRNWGAVNIPALARAMAQIVTWPHVFHEGDLDVYENPVP